MAATRSIRRRDVTLSRPAATVLAKLTALAQAHDGNVTQPHRITSSTTHQCRRRRRSCPAGDTKHLGRVRNRENGGLARGNIHRKHKHLTHRGKTWTLTSIKPMATESVCLTAFIEGNTSPCPGRGWGRDTVVTANAPGARQLPCAPAWSVRPGRRQPVASPVAGACYVPRMRESRDATQGTNLARSL